MHRIYIRCFGTYISMHLFSSHEGSVRCNPRLCSSSAVKRLFSLASLVLIANRRCLEGSLFEKLLLLMSANVCLCSELRYVIFFKINSGGTAVPIAPGCAKRFLLLTKRVNLNNCSMSAPNSRRVTAVSPGNEIECNAASFREVIQLLLFSR